MIGKTKNAVAGCVAVGLGCAGASAQLLSPTMEMMASARAGGALDFRNERWSLDSKAGSGAGLGVGFESFDPVTFEPIEFGRLTFSTLSYDLDPWADFSIRVENFSDRELLVGTSLVLGPLEPGAFDTVFNSRIEVMSLDGNSLRAGDGICNVTAAGNGPLAYAALGGVDSAGLGDGNDVTGATVGSVSTSLGIGQSIASGLVSHDVGSTPFNAADPEAFWGAFLWGFQLSVSPGDSAVISGRVSLVPTPGVGAVLAVGGFAAVGRRRR